MKTIFFIIIALTFATTATAGTCHPDLGIAHFAIDKDDTLSPGSNEVTFCRATQPDVKNVSPSIGIWTGTASIVPVTDLAQLPGFTVTEIFQDDATIVYDVVVPQNIPPVATVNFFVSQDYPEFLDNEGTVPAGTYFTLVDTWTAAVVPEPPSFLLALGTMAVVAIRPRRR